MEYVCSKALTQEQWIEIFKDETIVPALAIELLGVLIYHFEGRASASKIASYTGRPYQAYNRVAYHIVEKSRDKGFEIPPVFNRKGRERFWIHLFNGRQIPNNNHFEWIIDSDIEAAFKEVYPDQILKMTETLEKSQSKEVIEGRIRFVLHKRRERNSRIVTEAKLRYKQCHPHQPCEICQFSFLETYGIDYIEAHHKVPLSQGTRNTKVEDFAMLCSNCHRMIHLLDKENRPYHHIKKELQKI